MVSQFHLSDHEATIGLAADKVDYSGKYSADRPSAKSGIETDSTLEVVQNEDGHAITTPTTVTLAAKAWLFPVIVAKGRLVNQTRQIPATTIFTPNEDGIYRLSVYATITKTDQSSTSQWYVNASWTDDSGPQAATLEAGYAYLLGQFGTYNFFFGPSGGGPSAAFETKASTPISYSISQFGQPDESAYSLYYALERLQ